MHTPTTITGRPARSAHQDPPTGTTGTTGVSVRGTPAPGRSVPAGGARPLRSGPVALVLAPVLVLVLVLVLGAGACGGGERVRATGSTGSTFASGAAATTVPGMTTPSDQTPYETPDHQGSPGTSPAGPASVSGVVRTAAGAPVAGVLVGATSLDEPSNPVPELAVITDVSGAFVWHLSPGRYRLQAQTPDTGAGTTEVTVEPDRPVRADLVLKA